MRFDDGGRQPRHADFLSHEADDCKSVVVKKRT